MFALPPCVPSFLLLTGLVSEAGRGLALLSSPLSLIPL